MTLPRCRWYIEAHVTLSPKNRLHWFSNVPQKWYRIIKGIPWKGGCDPEKIEQFNTQVCLERLGWVPANTTQNMKNTYLWPWSRKFLGTHTNGIYYFLLFWYCLWEHLPSSVQVLIKVALFLTCLWVFVNVFLLVRILAVYSKLRK